MELLNSMKYQLQIGKFFRGEYRDFSEYNNGYRHTAHFVGGIITLIIVMACSQI